MSCIVILMSLKIGFLLNGMKPLSTVLNPLVLFTSLLILPKELLGTTPLTPTLFLDSVSFPIFVMSILIMFLLEVASISSMMATLLIMFSLLTFCFNNLLMFYIAFELNLIPIFILILGSGYQPERVYANKMMVLYTLAGSLPLLIGVILWPNKTFITMSLISGSSGLASSLFLMVTLAFLVKLPIFSLHLWLPLAHVEAPLVGSMILAGVLLKLGGYGLIRLTPLALTLNPGIFYPLFIVTLVGAALAPILCLTQSDLKVIIAYSSVGHMSLAASSIFSGTKVGVLSALILFVAHGFTSSLMFFMAGEMYKSSNTRHILLNKGWITAQPFFILSWFLACLMNAAGPPSINLASEIMATISIIHTWGWSSLFLASSLFLSMLFNLKIFNLTTQSNPLRVFSPNSSSTLTNLTLGGFLLISLELMVALPLFSM